MFAASLPCLDAGDFRAGLFSERAAREDDLRAAAAEHAEHRQFMAEFEAWLDGTRDTIPDPTPDTLHSHAPATPL